MYDELIKMLRTCAERDSCIGWREACPYLGTGVCDNKAEKAADAIEELSVKVSSLQTFADNISKLPDCNTCLKKNHCEFMPKYGEYCRINCPAWLGEPTKEE